MPQVLLSPLLPLGPQTNPKTKALPSHFTDRQMKTQKSKDPFLKFTQEIGRSKP